MPRWNCAGPFFEGDAHRWLRRVDRDFQDDKTCTQAESLVLLAIELLCNGKAGDFIETSTTLQELLSKARTGTATTDDLNYFVHVFESRFPSMATSSTTDEKAVLQSEDTKNETEPTSDTLQTPADRKKAIANANVSSVGTAKASIEEGQSATKKYDLETPARLGEGFSTTTSKQTTAEEKMALNKYFEETTAKFIATIKGPISALSCL
ncbi:hypothetical protein BJ878DRAFT_500728 [Calycina marina]|uniref:Uncharacterized protein n=1 Tax=Calycina marina TaxID=1763456 RepID=A0A9P7Z4S2_9HELO|nr:hypothetical protein BJ878DRAFT_500728 [Calycina marina]